MPIAARAEAATVNGHLNTQNPHTPCPGAGMLPCSLLTRTAAPFGTGVLNRGILRY